MKSCNHRFVREYVERFVPKGQLQAFEMREAFSCELDMTRRCDAGCRYCYAKSTMQADDGIPVPLIYDVIDDLRRVGVCLLLWEGGEPLLRSIWRNLMAYAGALGLHNHVLTSGAPLADRSVAQDLLDVADSVQVHFDTVDERQYAAVRNAPADYYSKVRRGIDNLLALGARDRLTICVKILRQNQDTIPRTIDWILEELGLPGEAILLGPYTPFSGQPAEMTREFMPDREAIAEILAYYYRRLGMLSEDDAQKRAFPFMCNGNRFWCATNFVVNHRGDVKACTFLPIVYGNIHERSLASIFEAHKADLLKHALQENVTGHCKTCGFGDVCRGCRANAWGMLNDAYAGDPLCWFSSSDASSKLIRK